jgi:hypothetical protein
LNFGRFEFVTTLGGEAGGATGGGSSGLSPAQLADPGLFREATLNMGGYKIIYHEALADAQQQAASNTSQGSSYRLFPESETPRIDIVRGNSDPGAGSGSGQSSGSRNGGGGR